MRGSLFCCLDRGENLTPWKFSYCILFIDISDHDYDMLPKRMAFLKEV